jgi:hypothetical protein
MRHLQRQARLAFALCLAALPAGVAAQLALTDISHGEADVQLEWRVVRASALVVAPAVLTALRALHAVIRLGGAISRPAAEPGRSTAAARPSDGV